MNSPCYLLIFTIPDFSWNTEDLPYEKFRYSETQTLTKNRDTHPFSLIHKNFRYPKFYETQKGSPTTFCGIVIQKFWQKKVIHPLFSDP